MRSGHGNSRLDFMGTLQILSDFICDTWSKSMAACWQCIAVRQNSWRQALKMYLLYNYCMTIWFGPNCWMLGQCTWCDYHDITTFGSMKITVETRVSRPQFGSSHIRLFVLCTVRTSLKRASEAAVNLRRGSFLAQNLYQKLCSIIRWTDSNQ